jgi:hypothetical protein
MSRGPPFDFTNKLLQALANAVQQLHTHSNFDSMPDIYKNAISQMQTDYQIDGKYPTK